MTGRQPCAPRRRGQVTADVQPGRLLSLAVGECPATLRTSSTAGVLPARQGQETALGSRKSHPSHGEADAPAYLLPDMTAFVHSHAGM